RPSSWPRSRQFIVDVTLALLQRVARRRLSRIEFGADHADADRRLAMMGDMKTASPLASIMLLAGAMDGIAVMLFDIGMTHFSSPSSIGFRRRSSESSSIFSFHFIICATVA